MYTNSSQGVYKKLFDKVVNSHLSESQEFDKKLQHDLKRAVMLGNLYNETATIHYLDKQNELKVKCEKALACTERYLILRGGSSIPIRNIQHVDL